MEKTIFARAAVLLALVAATLAAPRMSRAQVPLINGFGGVAGYGTTCLSPNDDGSSAMIDLRPAFPSGLHFFSRTHMSMFVNTNGNITFSGAVPQYTPAAFPIADQPMIAPYWADVDIRYTGGTCMGGAGTSSPGDGPCENPTENGVWWHLEPGRIIVTWDRVGYYSCHVDHRMSFQLILTATGTCGGSAGPGSLGDFDVEFRYNRCEWNTGDASGGSGGFPAPGGFGTPTPAQAGFDAGDRTNYVEIAGSRADGIERRLCTMSNVGMPGIWRFGVRGGAVMCPDAGHECSTGMMGVCGVGHTQCIGMGTSCVADTHPTPEVCNGLDDDCNGLVDDVPDGGMALCPTGQSCVRGVCTARCVEGSCFAGFTCTTDGQCVETACVGMTCPAGQICRGGACHGACDGVMCPVGQVCRVGGCVDPCAGVTCMMGQVCEGGACLPRCDCRPCATGRACQMSTGRCVEAGCETMTCPAGQSCRAGACGDACMGVTCPSGQRCDTGNCVASPVTPDAGVADSGGPTPMGDAGGMMGGRDGGSADGGDASAGVDGPTFRGRDTGATGCGCRTGTAGTGGSASGALAALGSALALALTAGRRRRRAGAPTR